MYPTKPPASGIPLPDDWDPIDDGHPMPAGDERILDYAPFATPLAPIPPLPAGGKTVFRGTISRDPETPHWSDGLRGRVNRKTVRGKVAALALSRDIKHKIAASLASPLLAAGAATLVSMGAAPHDASAPTQAVAVDAETLALQAGFARLQAGDSRGTVVLDPGHGSYMGTNDDGEPVQINDPGAMTHVPRGSETLTIKESDITEAMAARMAVQLVMQGFNVQFTRKIHLDTNPHLSQLSPLERKVVGRLNSDREVLANRFNQRIDTAHAAAPEGEKVLYLVLHADSASNTTRRGAGVYIHPDTPVNGASFRLAYSLQQGYRNDDSGNLGSNATRGVIPGQEGFGALFKDDCEPEIGLGTRQVTIIDPRKLGNTIPYALIEMGYLSNMADTWRLRDERWASNFARATADAVSTFFAHEYEGRPNPTPTTTQVNGREVRVVPSDPASERRMLDTMAHDTPPDHALRVRPVTRCKPNGVRHTVRVADYVPNPPRPQASTTVGASMTGPRSHTDHATRPETDSRDRS